MPSIPLQPCRGRNGLTRSETLWVIVLLSGIVLLIVNTLQAEVERGSQRFATDTLAHLASQIYLGLEDQDLHRLDQLGLPRLGPGKPPLSLELGGQTALPLQDLMPAGAYLPADPWGYSYVLQEGTADGHAALFLISVGAADTMPLQPSVTTELCCRVYLPPANSTLSLPGVK
jgi:hypothetical protein